MLSSWKCSSEPLLHRQCPRLCPCLSSSHVRTEKHVAGPWCATPAYGARFDILWHSFIFSVDFLVHNAASVELAAGERRKGMCNISVRLTADAPPHERVLRCTEAEVWCKIVNTAGFQRGRFRARYCWDLAIEWDGGKSNPHSDVCWVKQPRRHAI